MMPSCTGHPDDARQHHELRYLPGSQEGDTAHVNQHQRNQSLRHLKISPRIGKVRITIYKSSKSGRI
jgi:hypothetical protein